MTSVAVRPLRDVAAASVALHAPAAVALAHVTAGYAARRPILHDVSLVVPAGSCTVLCGPSGSGKTTLLRCVLGRLTPTSGSVSVPARERAGRQAGGVLGYIPQQLGLVRHLTVRQNVLLGGMSRLPWYRALAGVFTAAEVADADEALERVGLGGRGNEPVRVLSGGERRRTAIARAFVQRPTLLVADEFVAELDAATRDVVLAALATMRAELGTALLCVEHDPEVASTLADRIVTMDAGRVVRETVRSAVHDDTAVVDLADRRASVIARSANAG